MADRTAIEWTDATWTPIRARNKATGKVGWHCEHASPGCANCYSESFNAKRLGTRLPFKPGHRGDVEHFLDEAMLLQPLRWRRPRKIFVCSMTDLFGEWVPDAWIDRVFAVMALAPQHTFQVLTKRSARMRAYMAGRASTVPYLGRMPLERIHLEAAGHMDGDGGFMDALKEAGNVYALYLDAPWPLPNVWLGISAEDQRRADERVPDLLATPAAVRFVSAEPLLGPIDLTMIWLRRDGERGTELSRHLGDYVQPLSGNFTDSACIDWIITGGETDQGAHKARPSHPDWFRSIRDQCAKAGVPYHHKQNGEWLPAGNWYADHSVSLPLRAWRNQEWGDPTTDCEEYVVRVGKKAAGRLLDGVEHNGMPSPPAPVGAGRVS